jgi:hypothetical protein
LNSSLDWKTPRSLTQLSRLALFKKLLAIRSTSIVPYLAGARSMNSQATARADRGIEVGWQLGEGALLMIVANLGGAPFEAAPSGGTEIFRLGNCREDAWAICASVGLQ